MVWSSTLSVCLTGPLPVYSGVVLVEGCRFQVYVLSPEFDVRRCTIFSGSGPLCRVGEETRFLPPTGTSPE